MLLHLSGSPEFLNEFSSNVNVYHIICLFSITPISDTSTLYGSLLWHSLHFKTYFISKYLSAAFLLNVMFNSVPSDFVLVVIKTSRFFKIADANCDENL